jgi:hypothetical protein
MSDKLLPEKLRRRYQVHTVDEMWRKHLIEGNVRTKKWCHLFGMLPSNPRAVLMKKRLTDNQSFLNLACSNQNNSMLKTKNHTLSVHNSPRI